ncbi:PH domain-containing protein [Streptomyces sp. J2-1]|uniref:PH domain-containing protein n=1 Tax=Streptomyces corallincola TaxID=2851888 RepID=UPI001C388816|nr:PH domain-containing protein [Streptomyces corallincola]MBV2355927.1 PH domain-containing protein [Streptomyces corallincola]
MTTPDHPSPAPQPAEPAAKDRVYRSSKGIAGGLLLLVIICWLGIDALFRGAGRTPWLALAGMILAVPLVIAFTLRPAVQTNDERLRIRNPFRLITLPWGQVALLRSGFSNEVVTHAGAKYQLWALPVSLRGRKRATRRQARAEAGASRALRSSGGLLGGGLLGGGRGLGDQHHPDAPDDAFRPESDRAMDDLRDALERRGHSDAAQGEIGVRWAYEVLIPAIVGAVLLVVLFAVG